MVQLRTIFVRSLCSTVRRTAPFAAEPAQQAARAKLASILLCPR